MFRWYCHHYQGKVTVSSWFEYKRVETVVDIFTHIQTMMKQSHCRDIGGSTIETSDSISFNFPTEVFQQTSYYTSL